MGGGLGCGVSPPTNQSIDKKRKNNRKRKKAKEREGEGGSLWEEERRLLGQFVGGRKVVAGSVHGRKKRMNEKKGK